MTRGARREPGRLRNAISSAGLLPYRFGGDRTLEVLIVHPGGPFWAEKDDGAWSIAKGEYELGQDPEEAASREFAEELGQELLQGPGSTSASSASQAANWFVCGRSRAISTSSTSSATSSRWSGRPARAGGSRGRRSIVPSGCRRHRPSANSQGPGRFRGATRHAAAGDPETDFSLGLDSRSHSAHDSHCRSHLTGERERLFEGEGDPDQQWLAPGRADEAEPDWKPADLSDRQADRRVAGHRRGLVAGTGVRVAVDVVDAARPVPSSGRRARQRSPFRARRRSRPGVPFASCVPEPRHRRDCLGRRRRRRR